VGHAERRVEPALGGVIQQSWHVPPPVLLGGEHWEPLFMKVPIGTRSSII